jgi:hypothetical protein
MINRHISFSASNSPGRAYNFFQLHDAFPRCRPMVGHSEKSSTNRLGKSPDRC